MLRKLNLILISFFLFTEISAQIKEIELDLSSKIVKDVLQQDTGLLWIGTDEGLNVFFDDEAPPLNYFRLAYSAISSERIPEGVARLAAVMRKLKP